MSTIANVVGFNIGIDLGSSNIRVWARERGLVLDEPLAVALQKVAARRPRVVAVGEEAKAMLGDPPPDTAVIRPVRSGMISDFDIAEAMIAYCISKARSRFFLAKLFNTHPRVIIAVPSGSTELEKRTVEYAAKRAGAGACLLVEGAMAAAIGAGLPVSESAASMIVDVGGGKCEVAVVSRACIVHGRCVRDLGGDAMDACIEGYVERVHNLVVSPLAAEFIKIEIGIACGDGEERKTQIEGHGMKSNRTKPLTITSEDVRNALKEPVDKIVDAVKSTLDQCEPEILADLADRGLVLSGGGAKLRGLDRLIEKETGIPVHIAEEPSRATIRGVGTFLGELDYVLPADEGILRDVLREIRECHGRRRLQG